MSDPTPGVYRKRIGLALSGGVTRGPAHLGVLSVLKREGIPIDCVAGVSAGAIAGALYCAGVDPEQAQATLQDFAWRKLARPVWPARGWVSFEKLERWLIKTIGDISFDELLCPLAVVATDLVTGEPVIVRAGKVAPAVHASCAVPGFAVPVELGGRGLGDGGSSENLPARAARALGADYVIGVDLFPPRRKLGQGPVGLGLAALENLVRRSSGGLDAVDCLIVPDVAEMSYLRFGQAMELVALGARATEAQLPRLRAALAT